MTCYRTHLKTSIPYDNKGFVYESQLDPPSVKRSVTTATPNGTSESPNEVPTIMIEGTGISNNSSFNY